MNYYDILKVSQTASQQEIRDSYKKLIKKYHPDIYKGNQEYAEQITKKLNDAYKILSHPDKRKEYDLTLQVNTSYIPPKQNYENIITEYEEPPKETIEQILKKKIYNIVDQKTQNMSKKSKTLLVIAVILTALLLTAISIQDFINIMQ